MIMQRLIIKYMSNMFLNDNLQITRPGNKIKTIKLQNKEILIQKYKLDPIIYSNQINIQPSIVKFSGYEIGKLNMIVVKIMNTTTKSLRVHILPPSTPYFAIKFDKREFLSAGKSEDIYVHFIPNEYRYYFDTMRIHTETDQILIPIYGYPVLDSNNIGGEIFPRLIDFGPCLIGSTQSKTFPLICKIPLNFEYEFTIIKESNDIMIITPLKGIIPGKGSTEIEIMFKPTLYTSSMCELQLNISQFNLEPINIKIIGSGTFKNQSFERETRKIQEEKSIVNFNGTSPSIEIKPVLVTITDSMKKVKTGSEMEQERLDTLMQSRIYIGSAKKRRKTQMMDLNEDNKSRMLTVVPIAQEPSGLKTSRGNLEIIGGIEPIYRQSLEKDFLKRIHEIEDLKKQKTIRFIRRIGDPNPSDQARQAINIERLNHKTKFLTEFENSGITRYSVKYDEQPLIIGEIIVENNPTYDFIRNDEKWRRQQALRKLMRAASKGVLRNRADNCIQKIKKFLGGKQTREEVKILVALDWEKAENFGIGKKDNIIFNIGFDHLKILESRLPIQYEVSSSHFSFKFELDQRIGFDDFTTIDPLPFNVFEVMGYKSIPNEHVALVDYIPIVNDRLDRRGAEEEYTFIGQIGPVEPIESIKELLEPMSSNFLKPLEYDGYDLINMHPTLKTYEPMIELTENDPEYMLRPDIIKMIDMLDPFYEISNDILKQEYLNSTPGIDGIKSINWLPIEFTNYYTHRLSIPCDYGFDEAIEKYCPDLLAGPLDEDKNKHIDDDDIKTLEFDIPEIEDFLNILENEDIRMKDLRKSNDKRILDDKETTLLLINKNLEIERAYWCSILPTKAIETDKTIQNKTGFIVPIL